MTHHKQSEALQMRERAYAICNDQKLPLDTRQLAFVLAGGFTSLHNHITSLESQFAAIGAGGVEPLRKCLHQIAEPAAMVAEVENMRKALQFYADGDHFIRSDKDAWDTVSGEPPNYWCDEAGTATVEDGSIAKLALSGHVVRFEDEDAIAPSEQAPAQAAPAAADKQLADALDSLAFYRRRCELLQSWQSKMRDPERTIVCDILANGQILRGTDGQPDACRYALAAPAAQAAPQQEPTPTAGMTLAQRILHVGGRNNAAGYVEFGSTQAVEALVRQVLRDLPQPAAPAAQGDAEDAARWREIRSITGSNIRVVDIETNTSLFLEHADAAIDAARTQTKEGRSHD